MLYGRQDTTCRPAKAGLEQALLVAMQDTPGYLRLHFAAKEVEILADLCPSLGLKPVMPPRHRNEIQAQLPVCKIFHFAGYGWSDRRDPSRSCLLLEGWEKSPLTVGDLRDSKIIESSPFLGYLSACSTGANKVDRLVDEGIHLVSAFQLARFRHVVGTLWEVADSHCLDVARVLYKTIRDEGMTDVAICRGLHRAARALRDRHVETLMQLARDGELCEESDETLREPRKIGLRISTLACRYWRLRVVCEASRSKEGHDSEGPAVAHLSLVAQLATVMRRGWGRPMALEWQMVNQWKIGNTDLHKTSVDSPWTSREDDRPAPAMNLP